MLYLKNSSVSNKALFYHILNLYTYNKILFYYLTYDSACTLHFQDYKLLILKILEINIP